MSGTSLAGSDCVGGGGDMGRDVITSRVPWMVGTSRRVMMLGGGGEAIVCECLSEIS